MDYYTDSESMGAGRDPPFSLDGERVSVVIENGTEHLDSSLAPVREGI
jgi:hypothetical protein